MERIEKERFPDSKPAIEKPFKMHNDSKDITVWLDAEDLAKSGWELDRTPATQVKNAMIVNQQLTKFLELGRMITFYCLTNFPRARSMFYVPVNDELIVSGEQR